jgi:hypothetical protein
MLAHRVRGFLPIAARGVQEYRKTSNLPIDFGRTDSKPKLCNRVGLGAEHAVVRVALPARLGL